MIKYNDIISEVEKYFPNFDMSDLKDIGPVTVFSFLLVHIEDAVKEKNESIVNDFINLINEMTLNDDPRIIPLIDEIAISLYDSRLYNNFLKNKLTEKSLASFEKSINLWKSPLK